MNNINSLKKQNKTIHLIQNIVFTILLVILVFYVLQLSGFIDNIFSGIGSLEGPIDDVAGYGILVNGTIGFFGGIMAVVMAFMTILLVGCVVIFWIMFGLAYAKNVNKKKYVICTMIDTIGKILVCVFCLISDIGKRNLIVYLSLAGSIKILYNIYIMRSNMLENES